MTQQNFILVNADGLFNTLIVASVVSKSSLEKMEEVLAKEQELTPNPKPAQVKLWEQQSRAIELIRTLPAVNFNGTGFKVRYTENLRVPNDKSQDMVYIVPNLDGNFVTSVPSVNQEQYWEANPESWHLDTITELAKLEGAMGKLAKLTEEKKVGELPHSSQYSYYEVDHDIIPTATPNKYMFRRKVPRGYKNDNFEYTIRPEVLVDITALRSANRLAKLVKDGAVKIRSDDPIDVLGHADAFALYVERDDGGGYLDARGDIVDGIGGARLFESAKSAERTAVSRRLRNSVVVSVEVNVNGLAPGHTAANTDRLREVISYLTRAKLMDLVASIRGEDISDLRDKINAREEQLNTEAQTPKKKPMM